MELTVTLELNRAEIGLLTEALCEILRRIDVYTVIETGQTADVGELLEKILLARSRFAGETQ